MKKSALKMTRFFYQLLGGFVIIFMTLGFHDLMTFVI